MRLCDATLISSIIALDPYPRIQMKPTETKNQTAIGALPRYLVACWRTFVVAVGAAPLGRHQPDSTLG
jgi:hypothetical protein